MFVLVFFGFDSIFPFVNSWVGVSYCWSKLERWNKGDGLKSRASWGSKFSQVIISISLCYIRSICSWKSSSFLSLISRYSTIHSVLSRI